MNGLLTNSVDPEYLKTVLAWYQNQDKQVLQNFQNMMLKCNSEDLQELLNIYNENALKKQQEAYVFNVLNNVVRGIHFDENKNTFVLLHNLNTVFLSKLMKDFEHPKDAAKFLEQLIAYT